MKVVPHIKRRKLGADEVRIITVDEDAIAELLVENLMEHQEDYFDIDAISGDHICITNWDQQEKVLTYAVMPLKYALDGCGLNFEYIRKQCGITTNSLFRENRYQSLTITKEMLIRGQGNDSVVSSDNDC